MYTGFDKGDRALRAHLFHPQVRCGINGKTKKRLQSLQDELEEQKEEIESLKDEVGELKLQQNLPNRPT